MPDKESSLTILPASNEAEGDHMKSPSIEDTLILVASLHRGQIDKNWRPYIFHLIGVMNRLPTYNGKKAGLLHDSSEDPGLKIETLRTMGYEEEVIEAVDCVTKRPEEENDYEAFINRVLKGSLLARQVKIADLEDNIDPSRRPQNDNKEKYEKRMAKYSRAKKLLEASL
jgi:(p)ppGpp synthase/HD superfamily hydrolase